MIAILAIIIALISIILKAVNNMSYLSLLSKSSEPEDFFSALSPIFLSDKGQEQSNEKLRKPGKRIRGNLWFFYISIIVFFGYVSF